MFDAPLAASGYCAATALSSFVPFFPSLTPCLRTRYKKKNLLKDHITHNGICMIIALLGILIIHAACSASPPTSWRGVRARLGTMSPSSAAAHCVSDSFAPLIASWATGALKGRRCHKPASLRRSGAKRRRCVASA